MDARVAHTLRQFEQDGRCSADGSGSVLYQPMTTNVCADRPDRTPAGDWRKRLNVTLGLTMDQVHTVLATSVNPGKGKDDERKVCSWVEEGSSGDSCFHLCVLICAPISSCDTVARLLPRDQGGNVVAKKSLRSPIDRQTSVKDFAKLR